MQIADMLFLDTDGLPKPVRATRSTLPKPEDMHDLGRLVSVQELPNHLCKVWYGINDVEALGQFFASDIHWGEVDVLSSSATRGSLTPPSGLKPTCGEEHCNLRDLLWCFEQHGRGIRLDIGKGGQLIEEILDAVAASAIDDERLWFNADIETLRKEGFRALAEEHPRSLVQCPIGFIAPLLTVSPRKTESMLDLLYDWGINRFSLSWRAPGRQKIIETLYRWGFDLNIVGVPNLHAEILLPRPVHSQFRHQNKQPERPYAVGLGTNQIGTQMSEQRGDHGL
jgi:hypothetical protein